MSCTPYDQIPALSNYYLEDSYLLAIHILPGKLIFRVEAVLTSAHPAYVEPAEDKMYCYRLIDIIFNDVTSIQKFSIEFSIAIDANDEKDMGSIDCLTVSNGKGIHMMGPWGVAQFVANCVEVNLVETGGAS